MTTPESRKKKQVQDYYKPERKVKAQVKCFLKARGAYYFMPVQTGYGPPCLDFLGCYNGRFFAIETKAPGGKPTARQRFTMEQMTAAGGRCYVCDGDMRALLYWWATFVCPT